MNFRKEEKSRTQVLHQSTYETMQCGSARYKKRFLWTVLGLLKRAVQSLFITVKDSLVEEDVRIGESCRHVINVAKMDISLEAVNRAAEYSTCVSESLQTACVHRERRTSLA